MEFHQILTKGKLLELEKQLEDVFVSLRLYGATDEYWAKLYELLHTLRTHYTKEKLSMLPLNTGLHPDVVEKYFQFREYHNRVEPRYRLN